MNKFEFLTKIDWNDKDNYAKFLNLIKELCKTETIADHERHVKILNTKQYVYALSMANIRNIAKAISKGDSLKFLQISQDNSYEEITIQGLVIAMIKDLDMQVKLFTDWVLKIDNWSSCDTVVSTMKSLKYSKNKSKYFNHYQQLCFDSHEYVARFGIVCLMAIYLEEEYIDKIFDTCKNIKHQGYYVKMAVAWLISFAFVKFKNKTFKLLEQKCLDKFTQNKAISKCRDSYKVSNFDKNSLIAFRIK